MTSVVDLRSGTAEAVPEMTVIGLRLVSLLSDRNVRPTQSAGEGARATQSSLCGGVGGEGIALAVPQNCECMV